MRLLRRKSQTNHSQAPNSVIAINPTTPQAVKVILRKHASARLRGLRRRLPGGTRRVAILHRATSCMGGLGDLRRRASTLRPSMMDKATYVNPFDPPRTKNQISRTKNQISGTGVESSWH